MRRRYHVHTHKNEAVKPPPMNRSLPALEQLVTTTTRRLHAVPQNLTNERAKVVAHLERLESEGGRHTIRAVADLRKELTQVDNEIEKFSSGRAATEYRAAADTYMRKIRATRRDTAAQGGIKDSLIFMSTDQDHQRFRRRSDLSRVIRMAQRTGAIHEEERHSVIDEFLSEFHATEPPVYLMHGDICPTCDSAMVHVANSALECPQCGTSAPLRDGVSSAVGFNDDVEFATFAYKRDNHFQEWLNSTLAKQSATIPDDVLQTTMKYLHAHRVAPADVTAKRVREALKDAKLRKYYDNAMQIACILTGRQPPAMAPEVESRLRAKFRMIQEPFEIYRDQVLPERKNFLSYSYVLFKLCEIENLHELKSCFSLLKGRDKLYRQDQIWKCICNHLNWTFKPSI